MRSDPHIEVECEKCGEIERVELARTARGWDDRYVDRVLERMGWSVQPDLCPECRQ